MSFRHPETNEALKISPNGICSVASSVGTGSTQGVFAYRAVTALPTTTNVLMLPVHVGKGALASNLVRQLKNLPFPIRRKRNPALRIRVVQDTAGHLTS
jgi:hypothetical protein